MAMKLLWLLLPGLPTLTVIPALPGTANLLIGVTLVPDSLSTVLPAPFAHLLTLNF
jgi:hypothetical protein